MLWKITTIGKSDNKQACPDKLELITPRQLFMKPKLIRITTVPQSLSKLLQGQLRFMSQYYDVTAISSPGSELDHVAKIEGVKVLPITMTRTITPLKDLKALWQLYSVFRSQKPLIVHTHTPKAGILGMLAAKLAGVPVRLHTVAGLPLIEAAGGKRKLLNLVEKIAYRCATKVYPNSQGLFNFILHEKFTTKDKLKIIGNGSSNGIDTAWFDPASVSAEEIITLRNELGIGLEEVVFLFVGRIVADKGINELIEAFGKLNVKYPGSHLVLVGDFEKDLDPLNSSTEEEISHHSHIHSVGYKKDVRKYFAFADVLTFPSYREGFPNVVLQAASMQLIAVVSDINGCNEIITQGENGWLVPTKDPESLRERMEWCLLHRQASKKMGLKGRKLIQLKFEQRYVWKELLKEYMNFSRN